MGQLMQLRLLLKKNFLLQIRRPIGTAIEILLPVLACAMMIALRQTISPTDYCFRSCTDTNLQEKAAKINLDNATAPIVGFFPDTPLARRIMETASCMSTGMLVRYTVNASGPLANASLAPFAGQPFQIRGYNNSDLLVQEASLSTAETDVLGAIVFEGLENSTLPQLPLHVKYAVRLRPSSSGGRNQNGASWRTNRQVPAFERTGIERYVVYDATFSPLQYMVNQAITRVQFEQRDQCEHNNTRAECPDTSKLTTTCNLIPMANPNNSLSIQFLPGSYPVMRRETTIVDGRGAMRPFNCTCNRMTSVIKGFNVVSADCICSEAWSGNCTSNGPVDVTCCGRCGSSSSFNKTFLPVVVKNFPYPNYRDDRFLLIAGFMIGLLLVLALIFPAGMFVRELVLEKQSRLRETMKMMGLKPFVNYLSWFIKQLLYWLIAAIAATLIFKGGGIFPESDGFLMFLFFLVYFISSILFLFMMSTWFSDPRVGMICAFAFWFVTYVPYLSVSGMYDQLDTGAKTAVCFFCINSALGMGIFQYSRREIATEGVTFSNVNKGLSIEDSFTVGHVFGMMIVNCVVYTLIGWYWSNVFPGEYGIPRPFYFFLQKSYWLSSDDDEDASEIAAADDQDGNSEDHEEEPAGVSVGIGIRNLRKVYQTGGKSKVAVENLTLNMYAGQITSLLGHNGAGKTTTMSMLVGLFPPTSGDAFINGHSVRTDINKIRKSLGLCPQHNVLYDVLTVKEHLYFFLELKTGLRGAEADSEVRDMLKDLQLTDKTNWQARQLSGGMKRKLSVAIALIGGSKVVVLDEPTSGMDPYARRATWDLLLKHKEGRTMLLTTHFMDEADLLGDRIAIMANGALVCSGSSLFLKTRFGVGYHLVVVKENDQPDGKTDSLVEAVSRFIPTSRLVGNIGAELSFVLPHEGAPMFKDLFEHLENHRSAFGISTFGVSVTTLEEVFHRVGESVDVSLESKLERQHSIRSGTGSAKRQYSQLSYAQEEHHPNDMHTASQQVQEMGIEGMDMTSDLLRGAALWFQQFRAMFFKRLLTSIRHPLALTLQLLFPVVLTICALLIIKLVPTNPADPALELNFNRLSQTSAYIADFRNDGNSEVLPLDTSSRGYNYLVTPSLIVPINITSDSLRFMPKNVTTGDCCKPNFIVDDNCIRERYKVTPGNLGVFASCGDSFGYKQCSKCLNGRDTSVTRNIDFAGDCGSETTCPAAPTSIAAQRRTTWFQMRVLEGSNTGDYFKTFQSGYSLHSFDDDLPDALYSEYEAACYNSKVPGPDETMVNIRVDCDTPEMEVNSSDPGPTCYGFRANPSCANNSYDPDGYGTYARLWFSSKSFHALPYAVNTWSNMHLRNTLKNDNYTITTTNEPLEKTAQDQAEAVSSSGSSISFGIIATLGMSFLTASFAFNPVEEVQSKSKHIQFVSGAHLTVYWVANYVWDLINYLIPLVLLLIIYAAFDIDAFKGSNYGAVIVLLLLFGWSGIPMAYLWSFAFSNPLVAYGTIAFFQFILGLVYIIVVFVLDITSGISASTVFAIRRFFYTLPHYSLAQGLTDVFVNYETGLVCDKLPLAADIMRSGSQQVAFSREQCRLRQNVRSDVFDWEEPGVGKECLYMFLEGIIYFLLVLVVEAFLRTNFKKNEARPSNLQPTADEDDDVAAERVRIAGISSPSDTDDVVVLKDLTKSYSSSKLGRPAADSLCLGIPAGECFGLLGVNGAGKTTSFNMLTGDVAPTYGTAYLSGFDVRTQLKEVQQRIGYCPQFDALCEKLTSYELLTMYARLRGIPEQRISTLVDEAVKRLNLTKWADRQCGTYSGGNKRKLGAAIALVGDPAIVFLDEPTSGMDPGARRFLWDVLTNVMRGGRSIVLTSHSMEECEALCTRLAIMVNGQFKCLGSIQHLKSKFGQGYTITLKVGQPADIIPGQASVEPDTDEVQAFMAKTFHNAVLLESHHGQMQYQLSSGSLRLSEIFGQLQQNKDALNIVDYSVSQTSLEQVFLNFARTQFTGGQPGQVDRRRESMSSPYSRSNSQMPPTSPVATSPIREAALPRSISPANIVTGKGETNAELV